VPPDFFNSREDAILLWGLALVGFALYKDVRGIGASLLAVLRSLLGWKLLLLFGSVLVYSGALVYGASQLGVWHTSALKATIYWFIGTAVVLAGEAVTTGARDDGAFLRKVLLAVVTATILVEFVVNVYALPLAAEIACVGVLFAFVGMKALAPHDPSITPATRTFIDGVIASVGLLYVGYFVVRVVGDLGGFFSRKNAEDFLVGPVLTLMVIPLLLAWAWVSRWEQRKLTERFRLR
jgi:hypothetical protein